MAKILVVEDDDAVRAVVRDTLESERHTIDACSDGRAGLAHVETVPYDLLVLDWELPETSGIDICLRFRQRGGHAPVLFLTGRASIEDKERGFAVGADDYLTKPFDARELLMRVRALLRRPVEITPEIITIGDLHLDTNSGVVRRNDAVIKLQPRESALLAFLMRHPDSYFSIEALLDRVWDTDSEATDIALRSCIAKLRRKIDVEGAPSFIESAKGLGYRVVSSNSAARQE